jgi:hypothetical protein
MQPTAHPRHYPFDAVAAPAATTSGDAHCGAHCGKGVLSGSAQHTTIGGAAASLGAAQPDGEFFSAPLTQQSHDHSPFSHTCICRSENAANAVGERTGDGAQTRSRKSSQTDINRSGSMRWAWHAAIGSTQLSVRAGSWTFNSAASAIDTAAAAF